jgi:GMP synthase-like glutamine amidotransferase
MTQKLISFLSSRFYTTKVNTMKALVTVPFANIQLIILSGSSLRMTVPPNIPSSRMAICAVAQGNANNIPILGICFGMQIMAWVFGGTIATLPSNKPYYQNNLYFNHNDAVITLPSGFIGQKVNGYYYSMKCKNMHAVQWHPEGSETGRKFLLAYIRKLE